MKLKALDQLHVSAVQSDSLRPGQVFDISDAAGAELLARHPTKFEQLADDAIAAEPGSDGEKAAADLVAPAAPPLSTKPAPERKTK